jgi:hypothetical protein
MNANHSKKGKLCRKKCHLHLHLHLHNSPPKTISESALYNIVNLAINLLILLINLVPF